PSHRATPGGKQKFCASPVQLSPPHSSSRMGSTTSGRMALQTRSVCFDQAPRTPLHTGTPDAASAPGRISASPILRRSYLVFVRAGADSHHQRLLRENPDRNWDCCVNWYIEPRSESLAEYYCPAGQTLNKLEGFVEFRAQLPPAWPYRY